MLSSLCTTTAPHLGMVSRLFDSRRYGRRLSVSPPEQAAEEPHGLAAAAGVPVAAVIREALRRALPALRREIERNAVTTEGPR